jgi:uncharacterized protein YccT (UPF0319 family)
MNLKDLHTENKTFAWQVLNQKGSVISLQRGQLKEHITVPAFLICVTGNAILLMKISLP